MLTYKNFMGLENLLEKPTGVDCQQGLHFRWREPLLDIRPELLHPMLGLLRHPHVFQSVCGHCTILTCAAGDVARPVKSPQRPTGLCSDAPVLDTWPPNRCTTDSPLPLRCPPDPPHSVWTCAQLALITKTRSGVSTTKQCARSPLCRETHTAELSHSCMTGRAASGHRTAMLTIIVRAASDRSVPAEGSP